MTPLEWLTLVGAAWLGLIFVVLVVATVQAFRERNRPPVHPVGGPRGVDDVSVALALFLAWASDPVGEDPRDLTRARAEVARVMPDLARQLDRLADAFRERAQRSIAGHCTVTGGEHEPGEELEGLVACRRCGKILKGDA